MLNFEEVRNCCREADDRVNHLKEFLNVSSRREKMSAIEKEMTAPDFWDRKEDAQKKMSELSSLKKTIQDFEKINSRSDDFKALAELAEEAGDDEMLAEIGEAWEKLSCELDKLELVSFLSGRFDRNNVYFSVHAGAGGTESCDWAAMLLRMYRRWFEKRGFSDSIIDMQAGDEAGVKSVTLHVCGEFAYGYLKAERGIHRLVRISPFDSNSRRHTSFASVEAFPELSEDIEIDIEEKDLRVDTFRASGAGGQHVNTTDSAVRITHIPTGFSVSCQAERSQHKNRATAMKLLKARLYELKEEERRKEEEAIRGEKTEMGWGNQIRSYVLHPYQMVKDLRTNVETGNAAAVLDGDIDDFIEAWLRMKK